MRLERSVAIPVVVDLLLRLAGTFDISKSDCLGRNPCCSGPTPSTPDIFGVAAGAEGRNPCCSGPTPSTHPLDKRSVDELRVAIPVVVDLLLRQE